MGRLIRITDKKTGKVVSETIIPHPKPGEKANTLDLEEGDIFEHKGELYKVTGHESIGCTARPLDTTNWEGIDFLFVGDIVTYKGR